MQNRRVFGIIIAVIILLLIPFVAMQFTSEMKWGPFDFMVAGVLMLGTGLLCELVIRKVRTFKYRLVLCAVVLVAFVLIWLELAVGIFGTPIAGS